MAAFAQTRRRPAGRMVGLGVAATVGATALALVAVAYVLWPSWPAAPLTSDAPALPIVVADTVFQVPPLAIRMPAQRHSGVHERVDLAFLWPSLAPPDPMAVIAPDAAPLEIDRVFVTIAAKPGELSPDERLKTIYPRYLQSAPNTGPAGLAVLAFRDGSPYQGEDIVYDGTAPDRFNVRCTRGSGALPGMCLDERLVGSAHVTVRFPRGWLADWQPLSARIAELLAALAPSLR